MRVLRAIERLSIVMERTTHWMTNSKYTKRTAQLVNTQWAKVLRVLERALKQHQEFDRHEHWKGLEFGEGARVRLAIPRPAECGAVLLKLNRLEAAVIDAMARGMTPQDGIQRHAASPFCKSFFLQVFSLRAAIGSLRPH